MFCLGFLVQMALAQLISAEISRWGTFRPIRGFMLIRCAISRFSFTLRRLMASRVIFGSSH